MATNEMATKRLGNTKARRFQITLNQVEKWEEIEQYLTGLKSLNYLIAGKEKAPTTGHEHIHIFVSFNNAVNLSLKSMCGAHIEKCRGTNKQNIDYVQKDGEVIYEIGEPPRERGGSHTVGELKQIDNPDELDFKEYNTWERVRRKREDEEVFNTMLREIKEDKLRAPEIFYITGGTGKGKTYMAYKEALEKYPEEEIGKITLKNDFIDIVKENAKCFVIEEFRPSQIKASDFLQLTDKYGYRANIKGGFKTIRPECIYICSIIDPRDIYHEEINRQFLRRITKIINLDDQDGIDIMAEPL